MRAMLCVVACLVGCTPTVNVQLTPPNPDVARWQRDITNTVNDHDTRLRALEAGAKGDSDGQ